MSDTPALPTPTRWANPPTWPEWSALLMREMELHGWPFGRDVDPEDYRDFFNENIDPHSAIEEAFNDGA